MRKFCLSLAVGLAAAAPLAQAAVVNFDNPAVVDINNDTGRATYREAGFALSSVAADFLPLDGIGTGGSGGLLLLAGSTLSIMADGGGPFSFSGLDAGPFDSANPTTLNVTGVFSDMTQMDLMLPLTGFGTNSLSTWSGLTELRFVANGDVAVDNLVLSPVPEPGSLPMLMLGLGAVCMLQRSRRRRPGAGE
jgi:hypothetical protein